MIKVAIRTLMMAALAAPLLAGAPARADDRPSSEGYPGGKATEPARGMRAGTAPTPDMVETPPSGTSSMAPTAMPPGDKQPDTAEVLGKLHASNQKEIEMGKLAQKNGQSKDVKAYGKTLVKDHTDADKKVTALAKRQNVYLANATPTVKSDMEHIPAGAGFDAAFAKSMVDDHQKDIAEVKTARDQTNDKDLKNLLGQLLPTLEKHEDTAARLAGDQK